MENSNPSSVNFEENGDFVLVNELTRVLNQKTGEFTLRDKDLIGYLAKSLDKNEIDTPKFKHLLDLIIKTGKPLFFTYKIEGKPMLGSLFASSILKDKLFFFFTKSIKVKDNIAAASDTNCGSDSFEFNTCNALGESTQSSNGSSNYAAYRKDIENGSWKIR